MPGHCCPVTMESLSTEGSYEGYDTIRYASQHFLCSSITLLFTFCYPSCGFYLLKPAFLLIFCTLLLDLQVKAAVEEYYLNSLEIECIEVTRELVHPNGMGEVLKVSD